MNSKFIQKYCKANNIEIIYSKSEMVYRVIKDGKLLYISLRYQRCLDYITEVIINDKHTNNR